MNKNKDEEKELTIELTDEVKADMAADPKLAAALRDLMAVFHQAHHAVQTGQYKTFDEAMEAITGSRPQRLDPDDLPPDLPAKAAAAIKRDRDED